MKFDCEEYQQEEGSLSASIRPSQYGEQRRQLGGNADCGPSAARVEFLRLAYSALFANTPALNKEIESGMPCADCDNLPSPLDCDDYLTEEDTPLSQAISALLEEEEEEDFLHCFSVIETPAWNDFR